MRTVPLHDFSGGLNLKTGPLDPKYAIDCADVLYGRAIATRPGFAYLTSAATTYTHVRPHQMTDGTKRLLAARSGNTDALNTSGTATDTVAKTFTDAVSFGAPGTEAVYLANGSDTVFKYTTAAGFSAPANQPEARYLAVQQPDNRLVATGFSDGSNGPSASTVNTSHVHFSDERAPETWTANSNVQLTPGDGEKIQGCAAWRNLVFVWKESKFFVFNGNTTDEDGNPVFNREPRIGAGLCAPEGYAVAPEGVFFLDNDGVYFTTGGNATRISDAIDPIFGGSAPEFFSHGVVNQAQIANASAAYWEGRLYISLAMDGSSTNNRILVYDPTEQFWSIYTIPAASLCVWTPSNSPELLFAHATSKIGRHSNAYTADDATAIASYSRTAWIDLHEQVSLRQISIWGSGRVTGRASVDYNPATGTGQTVDLSTTSTTWGGSTWGGGTWGGSTYVRRLIRGLGARGTVFSITFQGGGSTPMQLEQATCTFNGGRRRD